MPRGGRRPGAGAPRNNFNAMRRGKSVRLRILLAFLVHHPDKRALAVELQSAGFYDDRGRFHNRDIPAVCRYLWDTYFDCPTPRQSNAIKPTDSPARATAAAAASTGAKKKRQ